MTERTPNAGSKAGQKTKAQVTTTDPGIALDAAEEKVVRMRHGFPLSDDAPLPREGQGDAALQQKLLEIELRALEASGRLDELRQEAGVEAPAAGDDDTKAKIVAGLKQKMSK